MAPLHTKLRGDLEKAVVKAREIAIAGANAALGTLAISQPQPYDHMTQHEIELRERLVARARQLGDDVVYSRYKYCRTNKRLTHECAYEHWHQMLFARFLAENHLLFHPQYNAPVTLQECEDFAKAEGLRDRWEAASRYASRMLPQIFRPDDPVLEVQLAPEHKLAMKKLLEELPVEIFTADDSLGWVYQFWQKAMKDAVNKSGEKIDADSLPAVTQLFTEHYMVLFLLHNTLGAWWVGKHPGEEPPVELEYLRRLDDGSPAAGVFSGWPQTAKELKILDPCCGSGHFLVAAFDMMVRIRMHDEGLSAREACDAVIRENIHGLEIDARCTQIAAFALAMAAWKFPDSGAYRPLPEMNIACSGLSAGGKKEEWLSLANGDERLQTGMSRLYDLFQQAPLLGSLIDPRAGQSGGLIEAGFSSLEPLIRRLLDRLETEIGADAYAMGVTAYGAVRAVRVLAMQFHLIATNVPYLGRSKHNSSLKEFCERNHPDSKQDLATVFMDRIIDALHARASAALVIKQEWLYLPMFEILRRRLLSQVSFNHVARLGSGAFETISGEVVNIALVVLSRTSPMSSSEVTGIDVTGERSVPEKIAALLGHKVQSIPQRDIRTNPGQVITTDSISRGRKLGEVARVLQGIGTADANFYILKFWELDQYLDTWEFYHMTPEKTCSVSGLDSILRWESGRGSLVNSPDARVCGGPAWTKRGIAIGVNSALNRTIYFGDRFNCTVAVVISNNGEHFPAISAFLFSEEFASAVRTIDKSFSVTESSFGKVPFDLDHWTVVAKEKYPNGLPEPYSNDPTQWLFKGSIVDSTNPLHVAVARLMGYRWPDQAKDELDELCDDDGIVCLPAVRGETPAADRLRNLLTKAYGEDWNSAKSEELLAIAGSSGKTLDEWLRKYFFEQHCQLFHQRPFIWHISDGQRDGFAALVNYHRLDRKLLDKLIFTYLGDWIRQQEISQSKGEAGAEAKVLAARKLQDNLKKIAEGEAPYDIFVRWKPIEKQPIGWEPDLNDGVRMNIRPFMTAGVLFKQPKIKWDKDRGKDPESAPWFKVFKGERINDHHLTLAEKKAAREKVGVA